MQTYLVYLSVLFFCPYFCFLAYNKYRDPPLYYKRINVVLCFLILILITGLRSYTGTDYIGYVELYELEPWLTDESARMEWGFTSIIHIMKAVNLPVWTFFLIMGAANYIAFYNSFAASKQYMFLGVFFFIAMGFLFFSFNGVRQAFAMITLSVALYYLEKRRLIPYVIIIILGALIHKSVVLFIPLYFVIGKLNLPTRLWTILAISAVFINLALVLIFSDLLSFINTFLSGTSLSYSSLISKSNVSSTLAFLSPTFLSRFSLGLLLIYYHKDIIESIPRSAIFVKFSLIGVVLYNAFSEVLFIARLNNYFLYMDIFTFSFLMIYLWQRRNYRVLAILILYFLSMYLVKIILNENGVNPYKFI